MPTLSELLEDEKLHFVATESFLRHYAVNIRGLDPTPSEGEIEMHLSACKDYYEMYGTISGSYSPWLSRGAFNGTQKESN